MGIETALLISAGVAAAAGAAGSVMSGVSAKNEAKTAAELERYNANIAAMETRHDISRRSEEATRISEANKMAMLRSGMNLRGSGLLMLEDAKSQLMADVDLLQQKQDIQKKGSNLKINALLKSGRMAMIGGFVGAGAEIAGFVASAYSPGTGGGGETL